MIVSSLAIFDARIAQNAFPAAEILL